MTTAVIVFLSVVGMGWAGFTFYNGWRLKNIRGGDVRDAIKRSERHEKREQERTKQEQGIRDERKTRTGKLSDRLRRLAGRNVRK